MRERNCKSIDEDWHTIGRILETAVKNGMGVNLNEQETRLLLMKLRSSVDIEPLVVLFHDIVMHTLATWKESRPGDLIDVEKNTD